MVIWGTFQLDNVIYLRSASESKYFETKQNGIPISTGIHKLPKGFKIPKQIH